MAKNRKGKARSYDRAAPTLTALNEKQRRYIRALQQSPVVVSTGYAGTGKTFIAARYAAQCYMEGIVDSIVLTRPNVSAGKGIGFFPGTLEEKMDPWMRPLVDRLRADLGPGVYDTGVRNGNIKIEPFETMRGMSFTGFVILDEAQNTTPSEMKMFLSRYEEGQVVVNGDIRQSDIPRASGLGALLDMIGAGALSFPHVAFNSPDDIVRSEVCRDVIMGFDWYEQEHGND